MADIDTLEVKIESDASKANAELDKLIQKLGLVSQRLSAITGGKSMQDLSAKTKIVDANFKEISSSAKKTAESISKPMAQATKNVSEQIASLKEKYKDLGKGTDFSGISFAKAKRDLEIYKSSLEKIKTDIQGYEIDEDVYGRMYRNAIKEAAKLSNWVDSLQERISKINTSKITTPTSNIDSSKIANDTENAKENQDKYNESLERAHSLLTDIYNHYLKEITIKRGEFNFINSASLDTLKDALSYIKELKSARSALEGLNISGTDESLNDKIKEIDSNISTLKELSSTLRFNNAVEDLTDLYNTLVDIVSKFNSVKGAVDDTTEIEDVANKIREKIQEIQKSPKISTFTEEEKGDFNQIIEELKIYQEEWFKTEQGISAVEKVLREMHDFQFKADNIPTPFGENQAEGLEIVRKRAQEIYNEMSRTIGKFKPTELGIGEAYSEEFLKAQRALEKYKKKLEELKDNQARREYQGLGENKGLEYNIKKTKQKIREYQEQMVEMKKSGDDVIKKQVSDFGELQNSITNTGNVLSKLATVFRAIGMTDIASPLQKWSRVANQAGNAVGEMGTKAQAAMGTASAASNGFFAKLAAGASKFGYFGIAIAAVIVSIATRVKILKAELNAVKKVVTTLAKGFTALWSTVGRLGKNILAFGTGSYNAVTPIGKAIQKIIGLFKSRVLRQAITKALQYVGEGFEKLNEYSMSIGSDFHRNMSMLYSDLKLLGRTIATAFEPLINVAAPMIDFIIHKVIDLINVVNQAFAAITGAETWTKATYAMEEWGKEANKAGGSAKKLSKQLGAWEEINNITTNEPGGGGGGGGTDAIDIEKMFTTENVNEKIKAYMDRIKQAWETDADFTFVGNDIAQKLSDALQKINWLEIQAGARKLGKGLATLINGFIEFPYMAERIGANIAQAINTVIATFSGFVQNIHFDSVGEFIGNGIGSAIDHIHWNEIIGDLSTLGEGLANGINALLRTGVLSKIAKATGNLLRAGISGAYKFITTTDFINAGKEVGKAITEFFSTMNEIDPTTGLTAFEELGKGITDLSHGIAEFVVNAINNIDDTDIKQGFRDFFEELDFTSILLDCTIVISQIEKGLSGLIWDGVSSFFSGNSDQLADDIQVSFGDTLQKGIDGGIDNVKLATNWLYENVLKKGWENIRISSDWVVEKVGDKVKEGINNIKISANWLYENILKKGWENIQISSDWIVTKVGDIVRQGIQNIKLSANWVYENVLKQGWENIQVSSDWLVGSIAGALEKAFTKLKEKWQEITSWWDTNKSKLSEVSLNVKSPHISITWDTTSAAATAMQKMFKLKGMPKFDVQYYAQGGFPEDGWFRASQGEIMGQFDNGKSVVANNNQITTGIANAVYEGNKENNTLMRQEITVLRQQNEILQRLLEKESGISASALFNSVQQSADEYYRRTGNPAFSM